MEMIWAVKRFGRMAYYSYLNNFTWIKPQVYIPYKFFNPILQIAFYAQLFKFLDWLDRDFYLIGNAVQLVCLSSIFGVASCIEGDRLEGTFPRILITPVRWVTFFSSRILVNLLDGFTTALIGVVFVALIFGTNFFQANPPAFTLAVICAVVSSCGIGLLVGALGFYFKEIMVAGNIANYVTLIFCGVNFPVSRLPVDLQYISYSLPLTRSIEAVRLALGGHGIADVYLLLLKDLFVGFCYAIVGLLLLRVFEWQLRRDDRAGLY